MKTITPQVLTQVLDVLAAAGLLESSNIEQADNKNKTPYISLSTNKLDGDKTVLAPEFENFSYKGTSIKNAKFSFMGWGWGVGAKAATPADLLDQFEKLDPAQVTPEMAARAATLLAKFQK